MKSISVKYSKWAGDFIVPTGEDCRYIADGGYINFIDVYLIITRDLMLAGF